MSPKHTWGILAAIVCCLTLLCACKAAGESTPAYAEATPAPLEEATPAPAILRHTAEPVSGGNPGGEQDMLVISITPAPLPAPSMIVLATPLPTATLPAYTLTTVKNEKGHVKAHDVNLREGPGEEYAVIQQVDYLTSVVITGKTTVLDEGEEQTWYQITFGGVTGFMIKNYVGLGAEPTPTPKPTATPKPAATAKPTATPKAEAESGGSSDTSAESIPQGSAGSYSEADIYLAAKLIYSEGKSQSETSFLAMANVLYNRCQSSKFGGGVTSVSTEVYRSNQFTPVKKDSFEGLVPSSAALQAAEAVFNGGKRTIPDGVMYFRSAKKGEYWSSKRTFYKTIGGNNYYY